MHIIFFSAAVAAPVPTQKNSRENFALVEILALPGMVYKRRKDNASVCHNNDMNLDRNTRQSTENAGDFRGTFTVYSIVYGPCD